MSTAAPHAGSALPAGEPAPPTVPAGTPATASELCDNCGAPVAGRYCAACGQRLEPPVHSLSHFLKVAAEDLTHADSRLWRTLAALLFKPGYLTRQFLHGRRASYLPPVRLYLVVSVVFFLWASVTHGGSEVVSGGRSTAPPQRSGEHCRLDYEGPWAATLLPPVVRACQRIAADEGRSLRESMFHNLPRAMFLFLPLLAAAMMLMYWWPRHYYVEHLLLLVHNHAFVFLVLMLGWALSRLLPFAAGGVSFALTLYIPWYIFRSLRVVYGQSRSLTAVKIAALSCLYVFAGALMFGLTAAYSALTL